MHRVEIERAKRIWSRRGAPDRGGRAVTEEARTDEHTRIVVEVECGGANLHGDARHYRGGLCSDDTMGGAQRRNRSAATEPNQILQESIGAQAELLGDIARQAR